MGRTNDYRLSRVLKSDYTDMAEKFLLDDVPGARVPASRIRGILEKISAHRGLTPLQEHFLRQEGHQSLLQFAQGVVDLNEFQMRAAQEREARVAKREIKAKLEAEESARRSEISNRKNAAIFTEQKRKMARRNKVRELPDHFDLPFVPPNDLTRIMHEVLVRVA
jgi:hypothetical protein